MELIIRFARGLFSNFYIGTSAVFFVWIMFFDGNDLVSLFGNHVKLMETESEIEFYQEKINDVVAQHAHLNGSDDAMERFAREKFLMRKDNEEVFLVEEVNTSIIGRLTAE